ncbi:MAG: hypothetical protein IJW82_07595 [Clostridia bacterium]|nr:hypothetical protein [Clostridia bacterium]
MNNNLTTQTRKVATGFSDYCILLHLYFIKDDHAYSIHSRVCNSNKKYIPSASTFNSAFAKLKTKEYIVPVSDNISSSQKAIPCSITDEGKKLLDKLHTKFNLRENASWKKIAETIFEDLKNFNKSFYEPPLNVNGENNQTLNTINENQSLYDTNQKVENFDLLSNIKRSINGENIDYSNLSISNSSNIYDDNIFDTITNEDVLNFADELNSSLNYSNGYKRSNSSIQKDISLDESEIKKQEVFGILKDNPDYKENFKNLIFQNTVSNNTSNNIQQFSNIDDESSKEKTFFSNPITSTESEKSDFLDAENGNLDTENLFQSSEDLNGNNENLNQANSNVVNNFISSINDSPSEQSVVVPQKKVKQINNVARKYNTNYKINTLTNFYNSSSTNLTVSLVFLSLITIIQIVSILIFKDLKVLPYNFMFIILAIIQFLFYLVRFLNNNIIKKELKSDFISNFLTALIAFILPVSIIFCSMLIKNKNIEFIYSAKFLIICVSFLSLILVPFINILVLNIVKRRRK